MPREKAREERRRSLIPAPAFPRSTTIERTTDFSAKPQQPREKRKGTIASTSRQKSLKRRLERAVAARDALLAELYHRIGNHLQLISNIIRLEARDCASVDAVVEKMEQRLIALHHAYLALEGQAGRVPAGNFLCAICEPLKSDQVTLELSCDSKAQVSAESAAIIGIIVNEAVCNALKYAFPDSRPGVIDISFTQNRSETVLRISDNGSGIDPGSYPPGRGHDLLKELAGSVAGGVDIESMPGNGTCVTARFPVNV